MSTRTRNKSLAPKRALFVQEYLRDLNATQAAIRAGYAAANAGVTGYQLLKNSQVAAAIEAAKQARSATTKIDAEWVLHNLREVLDRVMQDVRPALDRRGRPLKDEDGNVLYRFDAANANRALELIGKHIGVQAFKEHVPVDADQAVIAALMAGRRRAAGIVIDADGAIEPDTSGVVDALQAGRRRAALSQHSKKNEDE